MVTFGERVKELRIEKGMTQEELALKLGYKSRSSINKIEKGIYDINQEQLIKFAEVFDVTPAYLLGVKDNYPSPSDNLDEKQVYHLRRHGGIEYETLLRSDDSLSGRGSKKIYYNNKTKSKYPEFEELLDELTEDERELLFNTAQAFAWKGKEES